MPAKRGNRLLLPLFRDFFAINMVQTHTAECIIEMEHRYGHRMRMHFLGRANLDLQALVAILLGLKAMLQTDPFAGTLLIFRDKRATAIKVVCAMTARASALSETVVAGTLSLLARDRRTSVSEESVCGGEGDTPVSARRYSRKGRKAASSKLIRGLLFTGKRSMNAIRWDSFRSSNSSCFFSVHRAKDAAIDRFLRNPCLAESPD